MTDYANMYIGFLPQTKILPFFEKLKQIKIGTPRQKEKMQEFIKKFEKKLKYKNLLNFYESRTVTNNFQESYNKKLNSSFKSSHPSNFKFLEVLTELIKANSNDFLRESNDIQTTSQRLENRVVPEELKFRLRDFQLTEFRFICEHLSIEQPTAKFLRHFEPTLEQIDELPESDEEIIEIEESSPNYTYLQHLNS